MSVLFQKTRRPRLDPTMIGMPTNFRHTAHIGSGDVSNSTRVTNLENQMSSKGGYDHVSPVNIELKVIDLPGRNQT
ncbi:hypothetical protein ACJMK2_024567 [Sinanodonta woodiana]|uniref:CRIB domain-containing protein n=1 Tax=Sinanodonta woodiana TaxID=1069815 RepID=A0ABD3XHN7_SINWO